MTSCMLGPTKVSSFADVVVVVVVVAAAVFGLTTDCRENSGAAGDRGDEEGRRGRSAATKIV